jgi:chromosomal replication initiator protein
MENSSSNNLESRTLKDGEQEFASMVNVLYDTMPDGDKWNRWICPIDFKKRDSDGLYFIVPNDFYKDWIGDNFSSEIKSAISTVYGCELDFMLSVVKKDGVSEDDYRPKIEKTSPSGRKWKSNVPYGEKLCPSWNFDNYVVSESNQWSVGAAMGFLEELSKEGQDKEGQKPLFIYAPRGFGKTHLMQAIGHKAIENGERVVYTRAEGFVNAYIDALKSNKMTEFRKKRRGIGLLLMDDFQFFSGKDKMNEEFRHYYDEMLGAGGRIVMASAVMPGV